ncbi:MAG: ATP-binding protein [Candidatus Bathyarchaeia archaeon]
MSALKQVGTVLDGASPLEFPFKVAKDETIPLHEYVAVDVGNRRVLAEVVEVGARNPLVRERIAELGIGGLERFGYEVAVAEVLGFMEDGKVLRPKYAPKPNTPVYLADSQTLQEFYKGDGNRLPVYIGSLLHRDDVLVPIHLQDLSFHLGIFAQTRGGKSYLAGVVIENILKNTNFPVVVIDIHGDYVMMDMAADGGKKHGEFNVVVYYPPKTPRVGGVTADVKELKISPKQMGYDALFELIGGLGELQTIRLRNIIKELTSQGKPFGLKDVASRIEGILEEGEAKEAEGEKGLPSEEKRRLTSILMRLEDLGEEVELPAEETPVKEFLRPKTLSVICLRGLRSRIQDAYTGLIVDLIFKNHVANSGDLKKAPPTFVFIEEAHRVAAAEGGRYASKTISTAIREGAKFGVFLALISQRPRNISPDIMANIGNYAVLRITNAQDQSMIESASESFSHRLVQDLPALNQGEAVLVGPYVPLPAIIKVSRRETVHYGVTPNLCTLNSKMSQMIEEVRNEKW